MPVHSFERPAGSLVEIRVSSEALKGNLLGDPTTRSVAVYLPPGYEDGSDDYPLLVDVVGFTGSGFSHVGWRAYGESVPQRLDRLVAEGRMGPVIAAFPDCFTSLGGNQYVNSAAMGNWEDFLVDEMLPRLEDEFRVRRGRDHRAIFGKSSGGYGAIVHGMRRADVWAALACHSGDMAFDLCYRVDFPATVRALAEKGGIQGYLDWFASQPKTDDGMMHTMMILAMAASYDPDPAAPKGIRMPVDLETCSLDEERWARWLAWDPIEMIEVPECQENLRSLRGLYIECGTKDQYHLVFGARSLSRRLTDLEIPHRFEEFDDNHSNVDYRMDVSLPFLYESIT